MKRDLPNIKGVRRYAFASLTAAAGAALGMALAADPPRFGVPPAALLAAIVLGAIVGIVGITRRSDVITALAAVLLVAGVIPAGISQPSLGAYAVGLLFGVALLLMLELVHMTGRYERAQRIVESENVPESHVNSVVVEARKTLATRALLAAAGAALAIGLAFSLAAWGPRQWRAATETTAPLGVAVIALALAGALSMLILARGARYRLRRETPPQELTSDVAE